MKILIATDGALNPEAAADMAARLASDDGQVTVLTVVEIPRRLLTDLREVYGQSFEPAPVDLSIETAGHTTPRPSLGFDWPGDDAILGRYVDDQKTARTEGVLTALADKGIKAESVAVESEEIVAEILRYASDGGYAVILVGTHGMGRFEGLLGSTSTKIVRRSPCAVLTIRSEG